MYTVVEWETSPWRNEDYLGNLLDRESVLSSPHKDLFFHIGSHVVDNLEQVKQYLG